MVSAVQAGGAGSHIPLVWVQTSAFEQSLSRWHEHTPPAHAPQVPFVHCSPEAQLALVVQATAPESGGTPESGAEPVSGASAASPPPEAPESATVATPESGAAPES